MPRGDLANVLMQTLDDDGEITTHKNIIPNYGRANPAHATTDFEG
jgi:hypothetical protein